MNIRETLIIIYFLSRLSGFPKKFDFEGFPQISIDFCVCEHNEMQGFNKRIFLIRAIVLLISSLYENIAFF